MRRYLLGDKGLTLVEVIIAATLMTLVLCGAFLLYEQGVRSWVWTEQQTDVVDNLRIAVDKVASEIREAKEIIEPDVYQIQKESLVFIKPSTEPNVNKETITYKVGNNVLQRVVEREYSGGRRTTSTSPVTTAVIEAVYFSRPNVATVKIELIGGTQKGTVSVRTAVYARLL